MAGRGWEGTGVGSGRTASLPREAWDENPVDLHISRKRGCLMGCFGGDGAGGGPDRKPFGGAGDAAAWTRRSRLVAIVVDRSERPKL